jgi:choline dehydrogenase-like flavoprotein
MKILPILCHEANTSHDCSCQAPAQYGSTSYNEYRGGSGPLNVSRGKSKNPLFQAFIDAGVQAGYPFTDDMNGYQQAGEN